MTLISRNPDHGAGFGASAHYAAMRGVARQAEDAGTKFVSVDDNVDALAETYLSLTILADGTRDSWIRTSVTNPVLRDPVVVAGTLSSPSRSVQSGPDR